MSGCRPIAPVRLSDPLGREFILSSPGGEAVCDIRGVPVFVEGVASPGAAGAIAYALRVFPGPFLARFVSHASFIVLPRREFGKIAWDGPRPYSARMGIKVQGARWYVRDDLMEKGREGALTQRLWYAMAARVAGELEGEEGFDRKRFQASFNRYLTRRLSNPLVVPWLPVEFLLPGVDPLYQAYFDRLVVSKRFDRATLRAIFREVHGESKRPRAAHRSRILVGREQPWRVVQLYHELVEKGYTWRLWGADTLNLGLQSAASRERLESSHRMNLHYANAWVNDHLGSAVGLLFPDASPRVLWAPGLVGSYETQTAGGHKRAALLAGSLLDVGMKTLWGEFSLHSYAGAPLTVEVRDVDDRDDPGARRFEPEWEVGVNYRGWDGALFLGTMLTVSFIDPERRYYGFVLRVEE